MVFKPWLVCFKEVDIRQGRDCCGIKLKHFPFMHNLFCWEGEISCWSTLYLGYRDIFVIWSYLGLLLIPFYVTLFHDSEKLKSSFLWM